MSRLLHLQVNSSTSLNDTVDEFLADAQLGGLSPKTIEWYR